MNNVTIKDFTKEELDKIFYASNRTWQYMGDDLEQACSEAGERLTVEGVIECIFDTDRIVQSGGLPKELYEKFLSMGWDSVQRFMKKNKERWY